MGDLPISRSQFYYYAMKLRDKLVSEPEIAHPYWSVAKIDKFLKNVDRYCLPTLRDIQRAVERERQGFRRKTRFLVTLAAACIVSAGAVLKLYASHEAAIGASILVAGMSLAILLAVHAWESAERRTVLTMQLYVWEQALRNMSPEALPPPPWKEQQTAPFGRVKTGRKVLHAWN